ncbi:unnamed protein product [Rhizophagus irregularis]|nr:unnamed protein product [Rhizophagus irregularis]
MKTGEMWNSLPNDLKNSFIEFANTERFLKKYSQPKQMVQRLVENSQPKSELKIIFYDRCHKDVHLNESSNEIPTEFSTNTSTRMLTFKQYLMFNVLD